MDRVLSETIVCARKHYLCDASECWNRYACDESDCQTSDQRLMVEAARADKWKILPGQKYVKIIGVHEGEICVYRARPGMHAVCIELGLFEE